MNGDKVMLGTQIRKRRQELGWSQEELANKMGYASKTTINKIELGINDIPQSKIMKFAEVLGISVAWLLELEDFGKRQRIADLIGRLDSDDLAKIEERIEVLLEQDKYQ